MNSGEILLLLILLIIGYLLGSVNTSIIVSKLCGVDIRKHGSKNAGMTNVLRTIGKKAAIFVLIGDIVKGVLAFYIGFFAMNDIIGGMVCGFASVLGHNWPIYFKFKGGKGALTSIALIFVIDYRIALIVMTIFALTIIISKYVSLGSILGSSIFPVSVIIIDYSIELLIFSILIGGMIIIKHKENIKRLLEGKESKINKKKGV